MNFSDKIESRNLICTVQNYDLGAKKVQIFQKFIEG